MLRKLLPISRAILCTLPTVTVAADTVKVRDVPPLEDVRIADLRDGELVFRGISGQILHIPPGRIEWIELDDCPAFGTAERQATTGNWNVAAQHYRVARGCMPSGWRRRLLDLRHLRACNHAGRFDEAAAIYTRLRATPGVASLSAPPTNPAPPGTPTNRRAMKHLIEALRGAQAGDSALRSLLLQLLIYENEPPEEHRELLGLPEPTSQPTSRPMPDPDRPRSLLPDKENSADRPPDDTPNPPQIPIDGFLTSAVRAALESDEPDRALRIITAARPFVGNAGQPQWRLLEGRTLLALERPGAAAALLMQLAEDAPRDVRHEALYSVGRAHEQLGQPAIARRIYAELLAEPDLAERLRTTVTVAHNRLKPD